MSKTEPIHDKIHVHKLDGCRPTPLAHYLKALGIFRLVAEQADPKARGWWKDDVFHLATTLDKDALERFFLDEYSPTPILAPWNGGSGFYPKDNKAGKHAIEDSVADRFKVYRGYISLTQDIVGDRETRPAKGDEKNAMLASCRLAWRARGRDWIDAAMTMDAHSEPSFPALLGTGGNDGRLDFTNNFMQRLASLFNTQDPNAAANSESVGQLSNAIWATPVANLESGAIGQFFPSSSNGTKVNPWDFVLMLEGALIFRAGVSRKCSNSALPQAAAPFAVRASGVAYESSDSADESARGEQWMPLWPHPSTKSEIQKLFLAGRSQVKKQIAQRGVDMARAASRIGMNRGISQFQRYGYIERNGLANFAVPIGRYDVKSQSHQQLLDEVVPWIDHFRRVANAKNAPVSFLRTHKACEEAMMICTQKPNGRSFLDLLTTLGRAEDQMLASPKHAKENHAKPIPSLTQRWADIILNDASSTELRLAFSLAAQSGPLKSKERWKTVRHHWLPLDGKYFAGTEGGLAIGPVQCAHGLDLERSAIALVNRRLLAMSSGAANGFIPLAIQNWQFGAGSNDIEAFLQYQVDDAKILSYARGLMAIDLSLKNRTGTNGDATFDKRSAENKQPLGGLAAYGLLRLAHPTKAEGVSIGNNHDAVVRCNPTIFRRLQSGDLPKAIELAARQLSHAGIRPRFNLAIGSQQSARRLAASLAFGISPPLMTRLAYGLTSPEISVAERNAILNATADS